MAMSDVLFEAIEKMDRYLEDDIYIGDPDLLKRITKLLDHMRAIQNELDKPPPGVRH